MSFERADAVADALEVFWRGGYAGTSPQDLVDGVGIGRGSLYHAFRSKRGLYDLALRAYVETRALQLSSAVSAPGTGLSRLADGLAALVDLDGSAPRGCFLVNAIAEHGSDDEPVAAAARTLFAAMDEAFRTCLHDGIAAGEVRSDLDVAQTAANLMATVVGASILIRSGTPRTAVENLLRGAIQALESQTGESQTGESQTGESQTGAVAR